jgi:YgiT-type zinc finger domain-containing protein
MVCFVCKGNTIKKKTNFMVDLGSSIIIVKNVPSLVCDQCGEVSYEDDVAYNLERIVDKLRGAEAEITVASYDSHRAA